MARKPKEYVKYFQTPKIPRGLFAFSTFSGGWEDIPVAHNGNHWWLCASDVIEIFDIPSTTQFIQLRAYKEPGPGRTEVKFDYQTKYIEIKGEDYPRLLDTSVVLSCKKLLGKTRKTWYIDLYYWGLDKLSPSGGVE